MSRESQDNVILTLNRDEAIVLFELIADYNMQPELKLPDLAERVALNLLVGAFEKTLVEPFRPEYLDLVKSARVRLVERYGNSD